MLSEKPDFEIQSTVKGHRVEMSIDLDSLGDLFDVLSGLYSDAEMAVLRELATNARDSHIEAGVTRPIEITLPEQWGESVLVIQDFGLGMSRSDIEDTYSKYGASTKRDSNDYNGTLGLGSKSPLTYTPQFTFVGVKDGIKTTVSVAKGDTVPVMTLLSEVETDEGNGVKVTIPVKAYNHFEKKAAKLFRFWPEGTVLVNGAAPERLEATLKVTDSIWITDQVDRDIIVMAGVPYPTKFDHSLVREHYIVAFVDTGEVSFAPSREALKDNSKTVQKIAAILAEYERGMSGAISADLELATTAREAFSKLAEWRNALGVKALERQTYRYKGQTIPTEFKPKGENEKITVSDRNSTKLSASTRYPAVAIEVVVRGFVVHGYDMAAFTPSHKKKLLKYIEDNNIQDVDHFILLKDKLPERWIDPARTVDWETIRVIKLPVNRNGFGASDPDRIPGSYDIFEQGDFNMGVPGDDIDQTNPIYYMVRNGKGDNGRPYNRILKKYKRGYTLVVLTVNRVDKFERLFPQAEKVTRELERIYKRLARKVTDTERLAASVQSDGYLKRAVSKMDLTRLDDPAFAEAKSLVDVDLTNSALKKLADFDHIYVPSKSVVNVAPIDPFANYPLVDSGDWAYGGSDVVTVDHRYLYMNAAFAQRMANKNKEQ